KSQLSEKVLLNTSLTPQDFATTMKLLQAAYLDNGYPFVKVRLDSVVFDDSAISAKVVIDRGVQLNWTKIYVKGDSNISSKFVGSLIGIKLNSIYSESQFYKVSQRLRQINYFEEIKPAEILFTKDGVELFTYLKTKAMSSVNGIVGLQQNVLTQKMMLTGELSLKLQNILRRGELLYIDWRSI